jgi:cyclopropane-fatty-acyl-phospholipid synthase
MDSDTPDRLASLRPPIRLRFIERLFAWMLRDIRDGSIRVTFPSGAQRMLGDHGCSPVELRILDAAFFNKVFAGGSVGFGESYVDGDWETTDLSAVLGILARNQKEMGRIQRGFSIMTGRLNRLYHKARRNTLEKSKGNIQEHYDLSNEFYETFLDRSMTYSSALFEGNEVSLEEAQFRKIDRMLDLAGVGEGDSILEIGSGWGALALRAAKRGCRVKTITLSEEQFRYAQSLFEREGVSGRVEIVLEDYRLQSGQYDAVLSCEMIEAVGCEYLESYFRIVSESLRPGGKAVIQAITIPDDRYEAYCRSCDWIQKHIFPGGHLPSPGAIKENVSRSGASRMASMHSFGRDYAETLRRWARDFKASEARVDSLGFDARFRRKWNYYLSYCEAGFDAELIDVKHVVIEKAPN